MFTRLVIEAKFLRLYTCHRCGNRQQGTTEHRSIDAENIGAYTLDADLLSRRPQNMPVGWGSYHDDHMYIVFRCPKCIKETSHK